MNSRRPLALPVIALSLSLVALAACSQSGSLGTLPPTSPTVAPSVDPAPSDVPAGPSTEPTPSPTPTPAPTGSPAGTSQPLPTPSPAPAQTMVLRAYYVLSGNPGVEGLVPVLHEIPETTGVARAAMDALLRGDGLDGRLSSAIPAGSRLLGLSIRDGIATVDLSREFESGGGSASMSYRLGQVVYTLTQFPTIEVVAFHIEGRRVTSFGPEGIELATPQSRFDYEGLLPEIFVDRPAFGAAIGNPAHVTGNANVFEASFLIAVLDGSGAKLVEAPAMATCGSGCRGTFDVTLRYDVDRAQWGTLRVYYGSAQDGSPQGVRDYPVWLTPAS